MYNLKAHPRPLSNFFVYAVILRIGYIQDDIKRWSTQRNYKDNPPLQFFPRLHVYVIKVMLPTLITKDTCSGSYQIFLYIAVKVKEDKRALNRGSKMVELVRCYS